nr:L2 [Firstpapillomavirinae PV-HMU-1]
MRVAKRKRASPDQLYRTCATGDCPPDVRAQYEQDTVADRILKWISSLVYFGGAGIGTGRGSGVLPPAPTGRLPGGGRVLTGPARTGPIGGAVGSGIDLVGPAEAGPILDPGSAVIDAGSPSVIPLSEGTNVSGGADLTRIAESVPEAAPPDPPPPATLDIDDPVDGGTGTRGDVFDPEAPGVASVPQTPRVHSSTHQNPTYDPGVWGTGVSRVFGDGTHADNIVIFSNMSGQSVGGTFEDIELQDLAETAPMTSSPAPAQRPLARTRQALSRWSLSWPARLRPRPVEIPDLEYLLNPQQYVLVGVDNPAFAPDLTIDPLPSVPDPDPRLPLADLSALSRVHFTEASGRVRVNRYGVRPTIRLRSGVQLGAATHHYADISSIAADEGLELTAIGEHTGDSDLLDAAATFTILDAAAAPFSEVHPATGLDSLSEAALVDSLSEEFPGVQLVLLSAPDDPVPVPVPDAPWPHRLFVEHTGGLYLHYPVSTPEDTGAVPASFPGSHVDVPVFPVDLDYSYGDTFQLFHILRRKRKRLYF